MKKRYLALGIGLALSVIGLCTWLYQIKNGLAVTNLNNLFSWGLYMGSFEFFIGLSSGGMLVYAIYHIWHVESLRSFAKIGPIASLVAVAASGVAILTDLGRPFHVLQMLLSPNVMSPLFWDLLVLAAYMVLCLGAVAFQLLPQRFAHCNGWHEYILAWIALPYIAVLNGVTTLLFAVQNTKLWWHSALLPADSVAVAVALGCSFIMFLALLAPGKAQEQTQAEGFAVLARISAVALIVHFAFTGLELATIAWNGTAESEELLHLLFFRFGILYGAEQLLMLFALCGYYVWKYRQTALLLAANVSMFVAVFIHRIMLVLPAFNMIPLTVAAGNGENDLWAYPIASGIYQPGEDIFITSWAYVPTLAEWGTAILPIGIIVLLLATSWILFSEKMVTE